MIGKSQTFIKILDLIKKIGNSDDPVLIEGETGTGKKLAARTIHAASARKTSPFVVLNCGSIPAAEFSGELLGHVKAALTEADDESDEMFECAQGGTLFVDELEKLEPLAQVALLRFLQEQQHHTTDGSGERVQDVRIIAACEGSLSSLVTKGAFNQDLYYRLGAMLLKMPPLRDRKGDAVLLANYFLKCSAVRYGTERRLDASTLEWIDHYRWPGNVRELENLVNREYLISVKSVIHIQSPIEHSEDRRMHTDRRLENITELSFSQAKRLAISEFERSYLDKILTTTEGNVTRAAKLVGKERRSLGKLLKKHGIDRHQYSDRGGHISSSVPAVSSRSVTLPTWIPAVSLPEAQPSPLLRG